MGAPVKKSKERRQVGKSLFPEEPQIPLILPLGIAFGVCEALIIQQIHYWIETNSRFLDGHYWCFYTYQRWAEQLGVYGVVSIRKAIKKLERLGIVVTGEYNEFKPDNTKWYRIDYDRLAQELEKRTGEGYEFQKISPPLVKTVTWGDKNYQGYMVKVVTPIHKTITKTTHKNAETKSESEFAPPNVENHHVKAVPPIPYSASPLPKNESNDMNAEDTLKKKKLSSLAIQGSMKTWWLKHMALEDDTYQHDLNAKQIGQLRALVEKVGYEKARELIVFIIPRWQKFSQQASIHTDAPLTTMPTPGYLLEHRASALKMLADLHMVASQGKINMDVTEPNPVTKKEEACYAVTSGPVEPAYTPSWEEIQAKKAEIQAYKVKVKEAKANGISMEEFNKMWKEEKEKNKQKGI